MYLGLDIETGGIGLDKSILELGLVYADSNLEIQKEIVFNTISNDRVLHIDPNSLQITKIDLVQHIKTAITYKQTGQKLYDILEDLSDEGRQKLIPVGLGLSGDLQQIWDKIITENTWRHFVSCNIIEIASIAQFLSLVQKKDVGDLSKTNWPSSLQGLCESYGIEEVWHTALGDARPEYVY